MLLKINYWIRFLLLYKNWFQIILNRLKKTNTKTIVFRNNLKLVGSDTTPLSTVVDEIFVLQRYTPSYLKIKQGDIVVDIGAHVGSFSLFASLMGALQVYAYEPDKSTFEMLTKNIRNNNICNVKINNYAITDKTGTIKLYSSKNNGGSSIYKTDNSASLNFVNSLRLADIFRINNLDKIDFLKVDCEGGEGLIINSTNKQVLSHINKISLEYHNNVSILTSMQIIKILKENGFKVETLPTNRMIGYIYATK